jgi:hypothetical protein
MNLLRKRANGEGAFTVSAWGLNERIVKKERCEMLFDFAICRLGRDGT